jgi:hypothetical protein
LAELLAKLPANDAFRVKVTAQLVDKLYNVGVLPQRKNLNGVDKCDRHVGNRNRVSAGRLSPACRRPG